MEDDFESLENQINDGVKRYHRMMIIDSIERGFEHPASFTTEEFETIFGDMSDDDFDILNKTALKEIGKVEDLTDKKKYNLLMRWGGDWLKFLMKRNEEIENYEACSVYHNLIKDLQVDYVIV
jgi:hypothetical protein